jgi:hypothetical protein
MENSIENDHPIVDNSTVEEKSMEIENPIEIVEVEGESPQCPICLQPLTDKACLDPCFRNSSISLSLPMHSNELM